MFACEDITPASTRANPHRLAGRKAVLNFRVANLLGFGAQELGACQKIVIGDNFHPARGKAGISLSSMPGCPDRVIRVVRGCVCKCIRVCPVQLLNGALCIDLRGFSA